MRLGSAGAVGLTLLTSDAVLYVALPDFVRCERADEGKADRADLTSDGIVDEP